ncbi:MAG: response regulator [Desulfobacteraceae bacterium]|nr:response regulator [Desulfobacteraceae bacterium]
MQIEKMHILVVDDCHDVHYQLNGFLRSAGLKNLHFADSVEMTYEILGLTDGGQLNLRINLILMDIKMADINGIEATRNIKSRQEFQDVPVLMITADVSKESLSAAFEAGAVDYITKPLNKVELIARVRSFLKLKSEMDSRKQREKQLEEALSEIQTLRGLIPICASCKKIRNDDGYWQQIETFISEHSEADFSHSICPQCVKKLYPQLNF